MWAPKCASSIGLGNQNMKCPYIAITFVLAYTVLCAVCLIFLGFGHSEAVARAILGLFPIAMFAVLAYSLWILIRCIYAAMIYRARAEWNHGIMLLAVFVLCLLGDYLFRPTLYRIGAEMRMHSSGGDSFRAALLADSANLIALSPHQVMFIGEDALPDTFRQLGAEYARVEVGDKPFVRLHTSGRSFKSGWILAPEGGLLDVAKGAVMVEDNVYRYSYLP